MTCSPRAGAVCRFALAAVVVTVLPPLPTAAQPQPLPYTFTKITDSVATPGIGGISCVGVNDLGTVVVQMGGTVLKGRDAASFTVVNANAGGNSLCPSINDTDEIAYMRRIGTTAQYELVKDAGGSETILATTLGSPGISPVKPSYLPSLNNAGRAVYVAGDRGEKLAIGPTGTTLTPPENYVVPASMNDADVIAFAAPDSSARAGLYRGSTTPLLQDGDTISGGEIDFNYSQRPGVNNSGTMAFFGRLVVGGVAGPNGVFTTDGSSVTLVGTGLAWSGMPTFSLNDSGSVVYRRYSGTSVSEGLYLGRPGLIDQRVIGYGDALDGSTLSSGGGHLGRVAQQSRAGGILCAACRWPAGRLRGDADMAQGAEFRQEGARLWSGLRQGHADHDRAAGWAARGSGDRTPVRVDPDPRCRPGGQDGGVVLHPADAGARQQP
jgi:hypothetical protein